MDRIRKALDLARLERAQGDEQFERAANKDPPNEPLLNEPLARTPTAIVYSRTRVFTPPAEVLERSRIMLPGSEDPAAAAFRMLRTQVLQRMDANGWGWSAGAYPWPASGRKNSD